MPPDAAMQEAALQRIDRRIDQEEVARQQYDKEHAKSDAILNAKAAIAGYDGTPRDRSGKASGLVGSHDRGAMEKGLHKKSDKVAGTKTAKEAAKWTKQLASESKTDQTGGSADQQSANEGPQSQTDGALDADAGGAAAAPGPSGGGGTGGGSAVATATGAASGGGTSAVSNSLTNAPPSVFSDAIDTAGADISAEGKKEAAAKQEALPDFKAKIDAPEAAPKVAIDTSPGDKGLNQGGTGDNAAAPALSRSTPKKLKKKKPGADMGSAQAETPPDVLANLFADSLAKIDTASTVNTNPGAAPTVKFGGGSDPARAGQETAEADTKIAEANARTSAAIAARPGSDEIVPVPVEQAVEPAPIEMPEVAEVSVDAGMAAYEAKMEEHGKAVGDAGDEIQGADFDAKLQEAQSAIDSAVTDRDTDFSAKVDESAKAVDDLNAKAAEDQDKRVTEAHAEVELKHADTRKKQDDALADSKGKSDKAKKDAQNTIESRRKADDKTIQKKYKDADRKAKAEQKKAESKAQGEKQKAEAKKSDSGWFSSMASAISSFVDGIAAAVTKVFDTLATAVSGILNAVKDAATSMIDAAISFATSTLDSLGSLLTGLVDSLIGDIFPGLAQALNDAIDSAVASATAAVTAIGEQLKNGVAAAIDGLNSAIQMVINAYKTAITSALAIASAVVSGDWEQALLVLLEGALGLAGIDKSQFYGLVGQGTDTLMSIVDDPGSFIGNLIDAVGQGFGQFAGNFGTHLMTGAIDWLTGSLGEAGVTLPDTWDAMGIFGLVMDVAGVSADKLKDKVGKKIGEENLALLETAWGYVEVVIEGGLTGLWEHVQGQLGGLWDGLIDAALGFLMEKVVTAAVTKIASMFSPVGAIVQAILTAWNVYQFVQEQAQKIMSLVTSVVSSMAQIVAGQLGPAAGMIEDSLAKLVPVAISLLANLLGLGGISQKVKEIVESLQTQVDNGIDMAIDKLVELGKAAFDAFKDGGGTKPEGQEASEMPDPAQLPRETVATTLGGMNITFAAERGGQGATAQIDGKWAGALGASAIPAMTAEADKMEGPGKAEAAGALNGARSQVASVDSQAGKFVRGEEEGLSSVQSAMVNLAAQVLTAVNAIADETGGDKNASVQNHERMASGAASVMEAPSTAATYADWHAELVQRARAQEQTNQSSLETDVKIDVDVDPDVRGGLRAGDFDVKIEIAPNTTTYDPDTKITDAGFDPRLSLTSDRFDTAKENFKPVAAQIGVDDTQAATIIEQIWVDMMTFLHASGTAVDYQAIADAQPTNVDSGRKERVDLSSDAVEAIKTDLLPIDTFFKKWMTAQELTVGSGPWTFWSGYPAKDVAMNNAGVCLETSVLGAVFDSHDRASPSNHMSMWIALSQAYAAWCAKNFKDKEFVGYLGAITDRSIFTQVEQPTFELWTEGEEAPPTIKWYATAATVEKGKPGDWKYFPDAVHGGITGAFASAEGLAGRTAMDKEAAKYRDRLSQGLDPLKGPDPLKPVKDHIKQLAEELHGGDPLDSGWISKAKTALNEFNDWCAPDKKPCITDSLQIALVDNAAEKIASALYQVDFDGVETPGDLATTYATYVGKRSAWQELHDLAYANPDQSRIANKLADIDIAIAATLTVISVVNRVDVNSDWVGRIYGETDTAAAGIGSSGPKNSTRAAWAPVWIDAITRGAALMRAEDRYDRIEIDKPENTDSLWANTSDVEEIKSDAALWKNLARSMWPGYIRRAAEQFSPIDLRMAQAKKVIEIRAELDAHLAAQPDDVRKANQAMKENAEAIAQSFTPNMESSWKRAWEAFQDGIDDEYVSKAEIRTIAQECFSDFFGSFGYVTPAGWLQLVYKIADHTHESITKEKSMAGAMGEEPEQDLVLAKKGHVTRLFGGLLSLVPVLGPAMQGIGRYYISYGMKQNKLRAAMEGVAEFAFLTALQFGTLGIVNVGLALVETPVALSGAAGAIGGAATNVEVKEATDAMKTFQEIDKKIDDQDFLTPGDIERCLLYLGLKVSAGAVEGS